MIRVLIFLFTFLIQPAKAGPRVVGTYPLSQNQFGLSNPYGVAFDSKRDEIWVAGAYSDNIVIIDAVAKKTAASIEGLNGAYLLAIDSAGGRAYAAGYNAILAYDTSTRALLKTFNLTDAWLYAFALDPVGGDFYLSGYFLNPATLQWQQGISRHDSQNFTLKSRFFFPQDADYYAWNILVEGSKVYVPLVRYDYSTYAQDGWLWVMDKTSLAPVQKVGFGAASWPSGIVSDTGNGTVYVADFMDKIWVLQPDAAGQLAVTNTITGLTSPWSMALDAATSRLYCPDNFSNSVYAVDTQSKKVIKALQGGYDPSNVAMDHKQGLAFVANYLSNDMSVFDLKTDSLHTTIDLRSYTPYDIALVPNSDKTLITAGMSNGILAWNRGTARVESFTEDTYSIPAGIALFPNLNKAFFQSNTFYGYSYLKKFSLDNNSIGYPSTFLWSVGGISAREESGQLLVSQRYNSAPPYGGALSLLDVSTEAILKTVQLGPSSDFPKGVVSNPMTGKAYVVLYATHQVAVADLEQGRKYKNIPVGYYPEAVAVNPVLDKIYVSNYGSDSVSVIDGFSDTVTNTIAVGKSPKGIAVKKKGNRVYVADSGDDTVTVIDGRTEQVAAILHVGGSPQNVRVDEFSERIYVANYSSASITVIEDIAVLDTRPPNILHVPVAGPVPENQPVVIRAEVTDDMEVAMVTLTYWEQGGGQYFTVPMKNVSGSTYEAQISSSFLTYMQTGTAAYFIDAVDFEGNGPSTGQTPGTAAAPNRFAVEKTVVRLWNYAFGDVFGGFYRMIPGPSAAIGEIREDLRGLEIATGNEEFYPLGSPGPMGRWFLFNSTGGVVFWKDTQNDEAHSSVNLYDLTGDGSPEMVGGTTSGNQIQAFDRFANWVWRYILGSHAISTPAIERLSGDGSPVVFAGSFDRHLRSINGKTGTLNWAFPASGWIWSSPAVADLDGDGVKEVVFGSDAGNLYVLNASQGTLKWSAPLGGLVRASAALADLDLDGVKEVLIGSPAGVFYCLDGKTGAVRWKFQTGGEIVSSAALGDLDGDGALEAVFGSTDGFLYVLDGKGGLRWKTDLGSPVYSSPALARRGADKRLDVYVTTLAGRLAILRGTDGVLLGGFSVNAQVVSSPVAADVDGDGKLEIFFQDRRGDVNSTMSGDRFWALRDMDSSVSPYAREWPMFRRDPAHTGLYPMQDVPPAKVAGLRVGSPAEGGRLELSWAANAESDIASYKVYRDGNFRVQLNSLSYADTGLVDGTAYTYQISAVDRAGQEGPKSDSASGIPGDKLAPLSRIVSPSDGTRLSAASVVISGTARDAGIAGVRKVEIRIVDLQEGATAWLLAAGSTTFSFVLADLKDNHAYRIASRAEDYEGNQEQSLVSIGISVDLPPAKAAGLSVSAAAEGGSLEIRWTANAEPDIASYKVYRDGNFRVQLNSLSYADTGLVDGTAYTYQISAVDRAGQEGPRSDSASGIPGDKLAPLSRIVSPSDGTRLSTTTLLISGTAKDFGDSRVIKVEIRLQDLAEPIETWFTGVGTSSFSLNVPGLLKDNHSYKIASRALDAESNLEELPVDVQFSVILPPSMVTGLAATLSSSGDYAVLTWNTASDQDITGYRIYSEAGNLIATTPATTFELKNLAYDTRYTYYVSAIDSTGLECPKAGVSFATPVNGLARASVRVPKDGKKIWGNAVTIKADATDSTSEVLFQYRKEGESAYTDISSADSKPPYAVYWNVSDARISTGTYYLRAVAYDSNGMPDLSPPEIRVLVDDANADIVEDGNPEVDPNVQHRKNEKLTSGGAQEIETLDGTNVVIPPGAVQEGEQIRIQVVSHVEVSLQSAGKTLKPAGIFRKFTFSSGATQFKGKLTLTLPVPDENGDGIVDGTDIKAASLKVYFFSESKGEWVAVESLNSNTLAHLSAVGTSAAPAQNQKSISVQVDHFTLFGLFQEQLVSEALQLGEMYVYPNPVRGSDRPTLHVEAGKADRLEIRIYDLSGDMVHSMDINSPPSIVDGKYAYRYQWDTSGISSGIYIFSVKAVKTGQGNVRGKGKIALIK